MSSLPIASMFKQTTAKHGRADIALVKACVTQQLGAFGQARDGFRAMGRMPMLDQPSPLPGWTNIQAYEVEKRKSSDVYLFNGFVHWRGLDHIEQLFFKIKDRAEIKLLWEYVMLSTWDRLLRTYAGVEAENIGSPFPVQVESNRDKSKYYTLLMTFCSGTIVGKLGSSPPDYYVAHTGGNTVSAYLSIAYHIGRLARIKESEELAHGDYALRHLIFDPKPITISSVTLKKHGRFLDWVPAFSGPASHPKLMVIDVENSHQAPRPKVMEENDRLLSDFRKIVRGRGNIRSVDRLYRDGYDSVKPAPRLEDIKKQQLEEMSVNMDFLF